MMTLLLWACAQDPPDQRQGEPERGATDSAGPSSGEEGGGQDGAAPEDSGGPGGADGSDEGGGSEGGLDSGAGGPDSGEGAGTEPELHPELYPADRLQSPLSPYLSDRLAAAFGAAEGLDPRVFMKVGDSISADPNALGCFSGDGYTLGDRDELEATILHFQGGEAGDGDPWERSSEATESGRTVSWALGGSPSPLESELSAIDPAFAVIQFGTNDMEMAATYKDALWPFAEDMFDLIDEVQGAGVLPLLVTMPPRLDSSEADRWIPRYNAMLRGLAQARQIPLVDLELGLRGLEGYGLYPDGVHLEPYSEGACRLGDNGLEHGSNMRNLLVLDGLDRLRRAALEGESFDEAGPALEGAGTAAEPFLIPEALPFADLRDSRESGESRVDTWDCASSADESGPEHVYRLELEAPTTIRAMVFDRGDVDLDLHVVGEELDGGGCLERDDRSLTVDLGAGTWHIAVDTWVDGGGEARAGEYLLVVMAE